MATSILFYPKVTDVGKAQAIAANNLGLSLQLTHVSFGSGSYTPTGAETALVNEKKRVDCTGVMRPQPNQMRLAGVWTDAIDNSEIREIGFWAGNVLFAVWSSTDTDPLGYKSPGVDFVLFCDIAFNDVPEGSITIVINTAVNEAISALVAHEVADDAHIQYLLRRDFVNAHSLMTAESVTGTSNAISITLPTETVVSSYVKGQQFVFMATANNTGNATAQINGLGYKSIKKNGADPLSAGDIVSGAVYVLFFDGVHFQLMGGLGGGGMTISPSLILRYEFIAVSGQTDFECEYTVGATFVSKNGLLKTNNHYTADDGAVVSFATPCVAGDEITVVSFTAVSVANVYSKMEADDRFALKGEIPTGGGGDGSPAGLVGYFARTSIPSGWLLANGSAISRAIYGDLFNAITIQVTGVTTSGSKNITGIVSTEGILQGMPISGTGIPTGTTVATVVSSTQLELSNALTSTQEDTLLCIAPFGVGNGTTTFNLPNAIDDVFITGCSLSSPLRAIGTVEESSIESHTHDATTENG